MLPGTTYSETLNKTLQQPRLEHFHPMSLILCPGQESLSQSSSCTEQTSAMLCELRAGYTAYLATDEVGHLLILCLLKSGLVVLRALAHHFLLHQVDAWRKGEY